MLDSVDSSAKMVGRDRRSYRRESLLSGDFQNGKTEIDIDDTLGLPARKKTEIKIENANGTLGKPTSSNDIANIVTLYLMAPPEYSYNGYELLQAFYWQPTCGMVRKIFFIDMK
ncbi:hypothetical protein [Coxiella-like endosymbiont]|uniref:hypothetical protein n=1 Tax=Coxiella-like endosymbiont TaxID=1592897 RepID=UPI00272AA5FA|nr:hypothetical protein [Coxiella-like endosymbiont]